MAAVSTGTMSNTIAINISGNSKAACSCQYYQGNADQELAEGTEFGQTLQHLRSIWNKGNPAEISVV